MSCLDMLNTAYKYYCKEMWVFNSQPNYIDNIQWSIRTIYAKYSNAIELSNKAIEEGREIENITGSFDLIQCNLWFEYNVEYNLVKTDDINDYYEKMYKEKLERQLFMENSLSLYI